MKFSFWGPGEWAFLCSDLVDFFRLLSLSTFVRIGVHLMTVSKVNMLPHGGESVIPALQIGQGWHMIVLLSLLTKIWFPEHAVILVSVASSLHHHHCHSASCCHKMQNKPNKIKLMVQVKFFFTFMKPKPGYHINLGSHKINTVKIMNQIFKINTCNQCKAP